MNKKDSKNNQGFGQVKPMIRLLIEDIMQTGFDIGMGGRYDKSESWNKENQRKEYDKAIKKYVKQSEQIFKSA